MSDIDLNLLRILEALLEEESVTGAARRLGVTQSAVSHALAKLRERFGDQLLVRTSAGMVPTARAKELREPIRRGLGALREALDTGAGFAPATAKRLFTVAMTDQLGATVLPAIARRVMADAPGIDLRVTAVVRNVERTLETAAADLVVTGFTVPPEAPGLFRQRLFAEELVCIVRADHPIALGPRLTLGEFCALSHVLVAPKGGRSGVVDEQLAQHGMKRRIAVVVPHFLVAPFVVAGTDLILTVAASVARKLAPMLDLRIVAPPLELTPATYWQLWHERAHDDAGQKWLRGLIVEECARHEPQPAAPPRARQRRPRS